MLPRVTETVVGIEVGHSVSGMAVVFEKETIVQ